jgi:hypothetical protein
VRLLRAVERVFRPLALIGAVGGLGAALYAERGGIAAYPWRLSWPAFAGAVLLFAAGPLAGAAVFRILLHDLTGQTPIAASARVWTRAFLARYLPSGALTMAVRLRGRAQLRATAGQIWRATLVEQLVGVIGGAVAATVALVVAHAHVPPAAPFLLGGALLAAVVIVRRRRTVALASIVGCGAWVTTGAAAWLIVTAMTPSAPGIFFVTGTYAFAWLIGFVVVFAPSGLGIREATLIALLSPQLGTGPATLVAVTLRLANTVGDLLAFSVVEAAVALAPSSSAGSGSTPKDHGAPPVVPRASQP